MSLFWCSVSLAAILPMCSAPSKPYFSKNAFFLPIKTAFPSLSSRNFRGTALAPALSEIEESSAFSIIVFLMCSREGLSISEPAVPIPPSSESSGSSASSLFSASSGISSGAFSCSGFPSFACLFARSFFTGFSTLSTSSGSGIFLAFPPFSSLSSSSKISASAPAESSSILSSFAHMLFPI